MVAVSRTAHDHRLDLLKGTAILAVLVIHGLAVEARHDSFAVLHYWQAVPIFFVALGYNAAASFSRRGLRSLRGTWPRSYLSSRARRLGLPLLAVAAVSLVLGAALDRISIGPLTLLGVLPLSGPGNYFVTLLLAFTLLMPALYLLIARFGAWALVGCFLVELGFELASKRIGLDSSSEVYLYRACPLRFLTLVAAGILLAVRPLHGSRDWSVLGIFGALGAAVLVYYELGGAVPFPADSAPANALSSGYPMLLFALVLRLIPNRPYEPLGLLGRASYHIFLVQILFFAVFRDAGVGLLAGALVACPVIGVLFHRVDEHAQRRRRA